MAWLVARRERAIAYELVRSEHGFARELGRWLPAGLAQQMHCSGMMDGKKMDGKKCRNELHTTRQRRFLRARFDSLWELIAHCRVVYSTDDVRTEFCPEDGDVLLLVFPGGYTAFESRITHLKKERVYLTKLPCFD